MTERIDHYAAAVEMLKDAQAAQDLSMVGIIAQGAHVHATLALVEQQRIANLIAVMAMALQGVGAGEHSKDEYVRLHQKINPQVMEGLGL